MLIGIEPPTNRNIREDTDQTVEYCVVISVPDMNATIQRSDFSVCVSTVDGTAMGENINILFISISQHHEVYLTLVHYNLITLDITSPAGQDYQAVTNMRLGPFGNSDRRQCFDFNIMNDANPEEPEDFMVIVQFCPGEAQPQRVHIDPQTGTTTIMDDDGELHVMHDDAVWTTATESQYAL